MFKKTLKKVMIAILIIIGMLVSAFFAFTNLYPSLGGKISQERQADYQRSQQFKNGKFHNTRAVPKDLSFLETVSLAYTFFTAKVPSGRPEEDLKPNKIDSVIVADYQGDARLVWFAHSAFLLQMGGQNILIDPMFGNVPAPHPLLVGNRFNDEFPVEIEEIPQIDAVIYSHDHYDHLDYESVLQIKDKTGHFYVPLGVGVHLEAWGVPSSKITEMDWWEETQFGILTLVCTPAQHFSGRNYNNNGSTLWSSWVIRSPEENLYFSGDSGYASHFTEIGEKYGPFDLALMECGQYNVRWADIHMMPEETAQAGIDVKAKRIMPIHWAGFKLALHSWTDPIERVMAKAAELDIKVITPKIGQEIMVKNSTGNYTNWWKGL